ncbi:MAG: hypothetical protein GKS07_11335 [Nitrosopumilus sp.]|nr:MAG: hypothetical protein GKS07_00190 [Nitrosopumilus sp.]QMU55427.1 MAG: hypothetical protein GKS07_11335 [Nitrosopumilus sp.]
MTVEERLNAVILNLEASQGIKYDYFTSSTLSYLYDIRDGNVPEHVLRQPLPLREKRKEIIEHKKLLCGKCAKSLAFVDEGLTINSYAGLCNDCFREKLRP